MFIQVDTVVKDTLEDLFVIRTAHLRTEQIRDFRVWHRGKGDSYQGIEGDLTVVNMEKSIAHGESHKWFVVINERESDFRDRLNGLNTGDTCPTVKDISKQ